MAKPTARRWSALAFLLACTGPASAQSFRADFDDLDVTGPNLYNFDNRYAQSTTTWETTHLPTGGWNGTGAAHVVVHGCDPGVGCDTSLHQFNIGWVTPNLGGTPVLGDRRYIRFRIRFDPETQFPIDPTWTAKFLLYGTTGTTPNSRWITHLMPPFKNQGCSPGFDYSHMGWAPEHGEHVTYADFGLPAEFGTGVSANRYAGFASHVNIGWSCLPSVLVTSPDHPSPAPKPQAQGAAPTDGWYHIQLEAVSGNDNQASFRTWANNNEYASPSARRDALPEGLGVVGWENGVNVGGYWGTAQPDDIAWTIDDFEVSATFDPAWYPGAGPSTSANDGGAIADAGVSGADGGVPGADGGIAGEPPVTEGHGEEEGCSVAGRGPGADGALLVMGALWLLRRRRTARA